MICSIHPLPRHPAAWRSLLEEARLLLRLTASSWLVALLALPLLAVLLLTLPSPALAATQPPPAQSAVEPAALAKAVSEMEQLDRMRISLASTLEGRKEGAKTETMKEVCKPVGMRAVAIGQENGWQVRQVAGKYRNPDHAPANGQDKEVIDLFGRHPEITGLWEPATSEQSVGVNYYRRIDVQPSCMACHGTSASRPAFVKENYPDDKAFDFKPGDLRGMYAVHLPERSAAISQATK